MDLRSELARLKEYVDEGLIDETEYRREKDALLSAARIAFQKAQGPSAEEIERQQREEASRIAAADEAKRKAEELTSLKADIEQAEAIIPPSALEVTIANIYANIDANRYFGFGSSAFKSQDYKKAIVEFRKAAELGHAEALEHLGIIYSRGLGAPRDDTLAYMLYALAASRGVEDCTSKRDRIASDLSATQLVEGQTLVANWTLGTSLPTATKTGVYDVRSLQYAIGGKVYRVGDELPPDFDGAPKMVVIPPGKFLMGTPDGSSSSQPQHEVVIGYWLAVGKYPVTVGEFRQFVDATRYGERGIIFKQKQFVFARGGRSDKHPMSGVCWRDAQAYVQWLSERTGHAYRLLSEAEWEYACRAGTTTKNYWGDSQDAEDILEYVQKEACEVGSKQPNAWGLFDLITSYYGGEWVEDCYKDNYNGAPVDGSAKKTKEPTDTRCLRGRHSSSYRMFSHYNFYNRDTYYGFTFRIARTLS